ncbi:MAG: hypothetical protein HY394_00730 [Candidatus Diapherotrites archaeon]|nr:hypothetical protein [Candidatus Diapherotrites archaeon]
MVPLTFVDETARIAMQKIFGGMEEARAVQAAATEVEAHHIEQFHSVRLLRGLQARLIELGTPLPQNLLTPAMNLVREHLRAGFDDGLAVEKTAQTFYESLRKPPQGSG